MGPDVPSLNKRSANEIMAVLAVGCAIAAIWVVAAPATVSVAPAIITALGFMVVGLGIVHGAILRTLRVRAIAADRAAEADPFKMLLLVLGGAFVVALLLAGTGTQFGIFPLESAVTALGVAVAVMAIVTAFTLVLLARAGVIVKPTGPAPALVAVPKVEEAQHVLLIEGIGEKYATRLNAHGIITIPQLRRADSAVVAKQIDCTQELVQEWIAMADLMEVKGIGPQYAELLVYCGIRSVADLATADAEGLAKTANELESKRKVRIQGSDIGAGMAKHWIEAAKKHGVNEQMAAPA